MMELFDPKKAAKEYFNLSLEEAMQIIDKSYGNLLYGLSGKKLTESLNAKGLGHESADLILDIIFTRTRANGKFPHPEKLFFTSEGLRWATPQVAADHCAIRMEDYNVADLTCGQGGQLISFSERCDLVLAVDLDPMNCLVASMNFISL
jgi:hypothetical protein